MQATKWATMAVADTRRAASTMKTTTLETDDQGSGKASN
jgi:hypothetical protein